MASDPECKSPKIGTLLRLKGGTKYFEFLGKDQASGKIILKNPVTEITYLVRDDEIEWCP